MGLVKSDTDPSLYYLMVEGILVVYVDDLFLIGSLGLIEDSKRNLAAKFDMKDFGLMHYFVGSEVGQRNGEIFFGQGRYVTDTLKRFKMQDCRPMSTPMITNWKKIDASDDKDVNPTLYRHLIGSLMYRVNTRPNICFAINTLSQFMVELKRVHWEVVRHILRYVRGTVEYVSVQKRTYVPRFLQHSLKDTRRDAIRLCGFTDANWAGSSIDKKSNYRYYIKVGSGMVSWRSKKQKSVALSSTKAEYMATSTTTCEAIWLRKLLVSLFTQRMEANRVYYDNQSCIKLSENPMFHDRSKNMDIRCHLIRDCVQHGVIQLQCFPTEEQVANILAKALGRANFVYFIEQMGMVENSFEQQGQILSCSNNR
eukprot:PITA_03829